MAKDNLNKQVDNLTEVENVLTKSEQYIEKNQKMLMIVVGGIVLVVAAVLGVNKFYLQPKGKEAQEQMFMAEQYFAKDSFNLALNGDGSALGFLDIIDDFGSTKAGNLACYYAGISYLHMGQYQDAINYLDKFSTDDLLLGPIAVGAKGDAYMELGQADKALDLYKKAYGLTDNELTTPVYMMKAAGVLESKNNFAEALKIYETLKQKYPNSNEGRSIDKYIARAKIKLNS
jgi:tetratricopeptide (TPR) repeat protein